MVGASVLECWIGHAAPKFRGAFPFRARRSLMRSPVVVFCHHFFDAGSAPSAGSGAGVAGASAGAPAAAWFGSRPRGGRWAHAAPRPGRLGGVVG